ncbi:MAG: hypothetical protein U9Q83_12390 [Bacteroidota bacterium]|nr:hypothetical protein [Bacteroidota bacterium]
MKKYILLIFIISFLFGCENNNNISLPNWMQEMTDTLETKDYYWGSKIYRHDWKSKYYYHLEIHISSCAYCNVYNGKGESIDWRTEDIEIYLKDRKNEIIMWEWKKVE